jgi:hypothetical protein
MHIVVCLLDTNRHTQLAHLLPDGSSTQDAAQASVGHGVTITARQPRVPALVLLVLHPCQQEAVYHPCTRSPD